MMNVSFGTLNTPLITHNKGLDHDIRVKLSRNPGQYIDKWINQERLEAKGKHPISAIRYARKIETRIRNVIRGMYR